MNTEQHNPTPPNRYFGIDLFDIKINLKNLNQKILLKNSITEPLFHMLIFSPFAAAFIGPIIINIPKIAEKNEHTNQLAFLFCVTIVCASFFLIYLHFIFDIYRKISSSALIEIYGHKITIKQKKYFKLYNLKIIKISEIKDIKMKSIIYQKSKKSKIQKFKIIELIHPEIIIPIYVKEGSGNAVPHYKEAKAMLKFYRETPEAMQQ